MPDSTAGTLERQVHKLEVEPASGAVCCSSAALNRVSTGTGKWRAWIIPGHAWEEARVYAKKCLQRLTEELKLDKELRIDGGGAVKKR